MLREAAAVALLGTVFAFLANLISPLGLRLTQNYFPGATPSPLSAGIHAPLAPRPGGTNVAASSPAERLATRLQAKGLHLAASNLVTQLFRDPRYDLELIVFIDARDHAHYQEGHIPGAYPLDPYRAENYFADVLPVCQTAEQLVVYCNGGDCEDSEFAAFLLSDAGIPKEKLWVYSGGMTEWATNGLPVELGGRRSGNLRQPPP